MVGVKTAFGNVLIWSLLASASATNSSSLSVISPSVATSTQANSSIQVNATLAQINATSTSSVQAVQSSNYSAGSSSSSGNSSLAVSPTSSIISSTASSSTNGSSSGGSSSGGSSSGGSSSGGSSFINGSSSGGSSFINGSSSGGSSFINGSSSGGSSSGGSSSGGSSSGGSSSGGSSSGGSSSGGSSSGGSSSGGSSSDQGLSESLQGLTPDQKAKVLSFDKKRKDAISEMDIKSVVKPTETTGEDISYLTGFQKLLTEAKDLGTEFDGMSGIKLHYSVISKSNAVQVRKFDCVKERLCIFPPFVNPRTNGAAANSILLPLECPKIVIKDPSSRKRRDVQISVEMDLDDLPMVEEDPIEYQHLYHYVRTRREALDNHKNVCLKSSNNQCFNTRLNVTLKITSMNYTSDLANKGSSAYKTLMAVINDTLRNNISNHNKDWHINFHSFEFRPGSVIASFYTDHSVAWPGVKNYLSSYGPSLGSYTIDPNATVVRKVDVVNGGWTNYTTWPATTSATIAKCGTKFHVSRSRTCSNPSPQNGGMSCTGSKEETKRCECGGKLVNTGGSISSPYWPSNKYPSNADCLWVLEAPFNHTVELKIADFLLEKDKKCFYDYVQIFDGDSTSASELLARTCGTGGVNRTIKSTDTFMTVRFRADKSVTYQGFTASWNKVVKPWKPPKPVRYKEQNVTVTKVISCPRHNDSFVPLGKATTCLSKSYDSYCYFEAPTYLISCLIGVSTDRNDLPLDSSNFNVTFKHIMHKDLFPSYYLMDKICVTWNTTLSKGSVKAWSKRGCSVLMTNISHTTCQCDHTGIFAVLVSEKVVYKEFSLLANTYAGIGVSFAIIIAAILHIVWKIDIHGGEVMRINMCVAIILMMMTFLIGANVQAEKSLCGFFAFLEYFSVLAQFFWLMLHGLRIHGKIKEMFASGMNIEIVYVVFGWGLPLLLSLIAIGIQIDIKNPNAVCWTAIAGGGMWGYGAPLLIVIMLNITVLAAIIIPTEERLTKYDYQPMVYRVFKDAVLLALFGITCVTAYLTVVHETFKAQYFLTVSVVLQAVAMFLFGREGRKDFVKRDPNKKVDNEIFSQNTNEEEFDKFDENSSCRSSRESYQMDKSPEKKKTPMLKNLKDQKSSADA